MPHPLERFSPAGRGLLFKLLLALTLGLMTVLSRMGGPLRTDAATVTLFGLSVRGIVAFEVAGDETTARSIIDSWDPHIRMLAAFNIGLDYLFLVAYSTTIGIATLWAQSILGQRGWLLARVGRPLAWGQWLAAGLDATENVALITMLLGPVASPWPLVARWCAIPKFLLIGLGLLYAAYGAIARLTAIRRLATPG